MKASPRSDFAPADPQRGRAALKAAGSTIQTGWPAPAIEKNNNWLHHRVAALNLCRLLAMGLNLENGTWVLA